MRYSFTPITAPQCLCRDGFNKHCFYAMHTTKEEVKRMLKLLGGTMQGMQAADRPTVRHEGNEESGGGLEM